MFDDHTIYTKDDFTQEEIDRKNILAVMVIDQGLSICKCCGKYESELEGKCESKNKEKRQIRRSEQ